MVMFILRIVKKSLNFVHFLFLFSIIFIFSTFTKRKIRFINNVYSEIGQIPWIDVFLRKNKDIKNNYLLISLNYGSHVANEFFQDLVYQKFKANNIIYIKNNILCNLLKPICRFKNQFISENYAAPLFKDYLGLKKIDWIGNRSEEYQNEIRSFFNLNDDDWFVLFFARDSYYDEQHRHKLVEEFQIRNADINTFDLSMKFIVEKGGHAIRIGRFQNKKLICANSNNIHDYAFNEHKNAKMDILLNLYCKFIIGTGSGIIDVGSLSDIPVGIVNNSAYIYEQGSRVGSFIPKLYYKQDNSVLDYNEYLEKIGRSESLRLHNEKLKKLKLSVMNNTAEDILALTIDFYNKYILNKHVEGLSNVAHFDENGLKINSKFFKKYNL